MRHTVEIADSDGETMQLSVSVETIGWGGSWRAIDKGYVRHNSGAVNQYKNKRWTLIFNAEILADGACGIRLYEFIGSSGIVNDQGTGTLHQAWAVGLKPGPIEWSLV